MKSIVNIVNFNDCTISTPFFCIYVCMSLHEYEGELSTT